MNLNQNTLYNYIQHFNGLLCIKRKQKILQKYVAEKCPKFYKVDFNAFLSSLNESIQLLLNYTPEHVVVLNEKTQFLPILEVFIGITQFKLKKYSTAMFSNTTAKQFTNAVAVISFHDRRDRNGLVSAKKLGIKTIGFSNFSRGFIFFDHYVPMNNFSQNCIALVTWYLATNIQAFKQKQTISFEDYYQLIYGTIPK